MYEIKVSDSGIEANVTAKAVRIRMCVGQENNFSFSGWHSFSKAVDKAILFFQEVEPASCPSFVPK